jgi:hypothetical protein
VDRGWQHSFTRGDSFADRQRAHRQPAGSSEGQRECLRGEWCYGRTVATVDGRAVITGALAYRPLCDRCERYLRECVAAFPAAYLRLGHELGQPSRNGQNVRSPFGPRVPLREDVDALMRLLAAVSCSWEARIRAQARLSVRDPAAPVATLESVRASARVIAGHSAVLLALPPKWMTCTIPLPPSRHGQDAAVSGRTGELIEAVRDYAGSDLVRVGVDFVTVLVQRDGGDGALELLRLHHRALAVLGEVGRQAETLDGVPCRNPECEDMALELAEPPSDPSLPAMYSRCASCHAQMSREDFTAWAAMYAAWADEQALVCRKCKADRCAECSYPRCACPRHGRIAA